MNKVLAELPAGSWTTYGDLAAMIGSHPVAVGTRLATTPALHAHRVLQAGGTVSPGFKWLDPTRTDDPHDLLRAEGISFDGNGRASEAQRMDLESLAQLIGVSADELPTAISVTDATQETLRDRFVEQLVALQGPEVAEATLLVLDAWTKAGGRNEYGTGQIETSCFLIAREKYAENGNIWPMAIYPSAGKVEVVFQHLRVRPPFDNVAMREELRRRLNLATGVTIAAAKIELRPGFPLTVLVAPDARDRVIGALQWFYAKARAGV
jgi:alkylated DNA nucleotide flippase Atl1